MMTKNLWSSLDSLSSQAGVLADWRREMGADFDAAHGYLRPTGEASTSFPCTHRPPCGCYHEINPHSQGDLVAACRCADGDCPPIRLEPADLIVHALNTRKLGDSIRVALGFEPAPTGTAHDLRTSLRIGTYGALHAPVFFCCPHDEAALLREIAVLWNPGAVPFILLTPTRDFYTATVEAAVHRSSSLLISCSAALAVEAGGKLRVIRPVGPLLQDFTNRRAEGPGLVKTVEAIGRDIHAVATNTYDLRRENDELRALADGGFLKFATRVDADDFRAIAAIMLMGNPSKAANALDIPSRTFYDRVNSWKDRGPDYVRMYRMYRSRKTAGRKISVRLEDSLLGTEVEDQRENPETIGGVIDAMRNKTDNRDYAELFRDILEALARQNSQNWQKIQAEVIGILREELPQ